METKKRRDASFWLQMKATLIRNFLRKKRGLRHTLREFLAPLYFLLIIVIFELTIPVNYYSEVITEEGKAELISPLPFFFTQKNTFYVVPNNTEIKDFMDSINTNHVLNLSFEYKETEEEVEAINKDDENSIYGAIVFNKNIIEQLDYKIRMSSSNRSYVLPSSTSLWASKTSCRDEPQDDKSSSGSSMLDSLTSLVGINKFDSDPADLLLNSYADIADIPLRFPSGCPVTSYYWSGFATVQALIEHEWIRTKVSDHKTPNVSLQMLPKNEATADTETVLRSIIPLYLVISLSQFITPMLMVVVDEKEKKIKESMKMVGLMDSVFWISWFVIYSAMVTVISLIGAVIVFFLVLRGSNFLVLFVLMLEYGLSMIMFAFIITAFFSKAKPAGAFGGLITLLLACLYYMEIFLEGAPEYAFWLLSLLSPTGFAIAIDKMIMFDLEEKEFDIWASEGSISVAGVMIMIAVDILLYGLLASWFDKVIPTEYGTKRPPWFCFQPSYWVSSFRSPKNMSDLRRGNLDNSEDDSKFFGPDVEKLPHSMRGKEAIVIDDIRKTFKSIGKPPIEAVKGVSLKIYPGEITAILGHNGAGKTTLFNMLTGMTSVTSGQADIFGYDVRDPNEMEEIRKMTGICPQHDVLFDELTAREHLQFFGRIRGLTEEQIEVEVKSILKDIDLEEKENALAKTLSGGQKRKLSVGIALIGDPKIIFLDEPTAGVDPFSRRHMWSVLKKRKEGKVILLTTHFMDEADILADRKAIISQGNVRCYGSSLFLKNKFGVGYHLTLVLNQNADLKNIRSLVHSYIESAEQARLFGREVSFILPRNDVEKFPSLFSELEREIAEKGSLGISSYGVSMTTLEEIFLHLGEEEEAKKELEELSKSTGNKKIAAEVHVNGEREMNLTKARMSNNKEDKDMSGFAFEAVATNKTSWQMYKALTYIRFIRKFREPVSIIVQMILPLIYVSLGIYLTGLSPSDGETDPALVISAKSYEQEYRVVNTYTYQNHTSQSLDPYITSINPKPEMLEPNLEFKDLLGTPSQIVSWDFRSVAEEKLTMTAFFNFSALHSIPVVVNSISNMYTSHYNISEIVVTSEPFLSNYLAEYFDGATFAGAMFIGFTYTLLPIGLALELIEDREIRAKNQLRVNGLSFGLYYSSFYTVLGGMMLIMCAVLLSLVQIFDMVSLALPAAFSTLLILYVMFTPCSLFFSSTISYMFDTIENGQFLFPIASYMGFLPYIAVSVLDMLQVSDGQAGKICHVVFAFISPIYIPFGIVYYINRYYFTSGCLFLQNCDDLTMNDYWNQYEIYTVAIACVYNGIFWFVMLRVVDVMKDGGKFQEGLKSVMFWKNDANHYEKAPENGNENSDIIEDMDEDVKEEADLISDYMTRANENDDMKVVAVKGLRKEFKTNEGNKKGGACKKNLDEDEKDDEVKIAVRNLTFGVSEGETFGLLGHNGAGKTTTMRIITAEEAPTCGRVKICKHNITSNVSPGFDLLGYCPQFDALWRTVTVREHLQCYAAIRGVPKKSIPRIIDQFMEGLRIKEHKNKYAKDCSGGTKRKLSYAMAMLGDPKIVLLDEPSTGMDPQSKRFVWDTILASFKSQRGAILTTHSMEEADALCTRIGIMVKGELRCLGSTQHLKNKYGGGYMLEVKLKSTAEEGLKGTWEVLEEEVMSKFPETELTESFADRRTYSIPQTAVSSLANAFSTLENLKLQFDIEEYSFGQTTLEQVFIEFAKMQEEADQKETQGKNEDAAKIWRRLRNQVSVSSVESHENVIT